MAAEDAAPEAPGHGLSEQQLAACMRANAVWPYDAQRDGWVMAHNALRADMADLEAALSALDGQLAAGKKLNAWQARRGSAQHEPHAPA